MSSLGSFKLISCPMGESCPHADCLFKHPDEDDKGVRRQNQQLVQAPLTKTPQPPTLDSDGGPRKRQKISDHTTTIHTTADHVAMPEVVGLAGLPASRSVAPPTETAFALDSASRKAQTAQTAEYDPASPAWAPIQATPTIASPHTPRSCVTFTPTPLNSPGRSGSAKPLSSGEPRPTGQSSVLLRESQNRIPPSDVISPPVLKRKLATPDPPASKSKKQTTQAALSSNNTSKHPKSPISAPMTPSTPRSSIQKPSPKPSPKPRKPEGLNPRLVAPAPASHDLRLRLLRLLHAEFARLNTDLKKRANNEEKKLVLSDQELIWRALDEEEQATRKGLIYTNIIKNRIVAYKRMDHAAWIAEQLKRLSAKHPPTTSTKPTPDGKPVDTGLTPSQEVEIAKRLLTPLDKLAAYGYVPQIPSESEVENVRKGIEAAKGWEKCDRCSRRFQVFPGRHEETGILASGGSCTFHHGRTYFPEQSSTRNDAAKPIKRYRCCNEAIGDSAGCGVWDTHIFKAPDPKRLSAVLRFAETPDNSSVKENDIFCFDCEMGYTVHGLELIRLTVTMWPSRKVVLDILVQPKGEILDLNSRYSGVFPEDIANAEVWSESVPPPVDVAKVDKTTRVRKGLRIVKSPEVARELFHSMISPTTILIGHGLENDLNACRMVHPKVIDTILLFPHTRGLPIRNGLKALTLNHLGMHIQVENGGKGHDSAEDARAAGELVRLKVKQEWTRMQAAGWKLVGGRFVSPPGHPSPRPV